MTDELKKRERVYVQRPKVYEMAPHGCGHDDPDWSEYEGHSWCPKCEVDFVPALGGVFDGPVPIAAMALMGVYFDRIDLKTNTLLPDPLGNSHFKDKEPA